MAGLKILLSLSLIFSFSNYNSQNIWQGSINSDWHNDCNWSLGHIPTAVETAEIPTSATYPVITGNAHCQYLNITSLAINALTINSSGGATLCVSSINAGGCLTPLTNNTTYTAANNTTSTVAICENQTKALTGSPGGGSWSIVSGGGSITGTTYTPPNVASNTSITVRYTIPASGSCASTFSDATFTVNSLLVANNTTSATTIDDSQTKTLTETTGGGSWSIVSGGGSIAGTTYTPADVGSPTSVTVRYTIPSNGACPSSFSDVTFTVNDATIPGSWFDPCNPSPPTGPFSFCSFNYNVCPAPGVVGHLWYNNTGSAITVIMPTPLYGTWDPSATVVIPANSSTVINLINNNSFCNMFTLGDAATWSSADGGSGSVSITQ